MYGNTLVIVNPAARSGKATEVAAYAVSVFNRIHVEHPKYLSDVAFQYTVQPKDATKIAAEQGKHYDTIFVVGGDGLVHETVNGLMKLSKTVRPKLGIIPCGNGDDFARSIHIDRNPKKSLQHIESRLLVPKLIDVGRANSSWFMETLSFGLDAAIALGTQELRKRTKRTGTSLYLQSGFNQLKNHRVARSVTLTLGDCDPQTLSSYMVAVQNGNYYGGGFKVCPAAQLNDGLLDVCYITPTLSFTQALALFAKAHVGNHVDDPHVHITQTRSLTIQYDTPIATQIDGEQFDSKTVAIKVFPSELEVLMPD